MFSAYVITAIKSRRMSWADNAARTRNMRNAYKISVGKPERNCLGDVTLDCGKILK